MVVDAKDGTVLGKIDLGGVPEQTVADGKGTLYVVCRTRQGSVAVVDAKTMKVDGALSVRRQRRVQRPRARREEPDPLRGVRAVAGNPPAAAAAADDGRS